MLSEMKSTNSLKLELERNFERILIYVYVDIY